MYQLLKIEKDPLIQVEYISSYEPKHVLEEAAKWHKADVFGFELLDEGQTVVKCTEDGSMEFRDHESRLNWMSFLTLYTKGCKDW